MDGFTFMNMISRIDHYEQIARQMARELRQTGEARESRQSRQSREAQEGTTPREARDVRENPTVQPAMLTTSARPRKHVHLSVRKSA